MEMLFEKLFETLLKRLCWELRMELARVLARIVLDRIVERESVTGLLPSLLGVCGPKLWFGGCKFMPLRWGVNPVLSGS